MSLSLMSARSLRAPFAVALLLVLAGCVADDPDSDARATRTPSPDAPSVRDGEAWIVFQGASLGLTMLRPDGAGSHVILDELPGEQLHPDWSPDGSRLAFVQQSDDMAAADVWLSDPTGTSPEPLLDEYPAELRGLFWDNPAWSPDGSQIAMVGYDVNASVGLPTRAVLAIVDLATDEVSIAGDYPFDGPYPGVSFPRWARDGSAMVLAVGRFDQDEYTGEALAVITRAGGTWSTPTVITTFDDFATRPDWHPTEDLIVFVTHDVGAFQSTDDASNLFTVRPDGGGLTQITQFDAGGARASQPTWTSDGRIIFTYITGANDAQRDIAFIEADGSGLEIVTSDGDVGAGNIPHPRLRPVP